MFMMRFDMRMPGQDATQRADGYQAMLDMAAWGDANGCATIALSEHHASEDGYLPSPFALAQAVAAVTTNVPIVVAAALLPLYDPVRLAEDLIVLDHLSRGRAMVVLGLGYRPAEYELHGVDYARRGAIADEKLEALLGALRDAESGSGMPRVTPPPYSPGGPMLSWGGRTKAAARRAGRNGLGFFAQTNLDGLQEAYEDAARAAGHEPGLCMLPSPDQAFSTFVSDDLDTAWDEVGAALLADAVVYAEWNQDAGSDDVTVSLSRSTTVDELRRERGAHQIVTVSEAVEVVRTNGMLQLHPMCGGLAPDVAWPYLHRVADEVLPAVSG